MTPINHQTIGGTARGDATSTSSGAVNTSSFSRSSLTVYTNEDWIEMRFWGYQNPAHAILCRCRSARARSDLAVHAKVSCEPRSKDWIILTRQV